MLTWRSLRCRCHRREKDIPIDMLELPNKTEKILQFAWEPRGSRFAVLHGEGNRPTGELSRLASPPAASSQPQFTSLPAHSLSQSQTLPPCPYHFLPCSSPSSHTHPSTP